MNNYTVSWFVVLLYVAVIIGLTIYIRSKKQTLESFALGGRTIGPFFIGLSLAANMTSAATFVINPGLVYHFGLAGFMGYSVAAPAGIFTALVLMTKKFRISGEQVAALTIPQWIGSVFKSNTLKKLFAMISVLQITFIVLITVGVGKVLSATLQLPFELVSAVIIVFTISYIIVGGTRLHIYTNTVQAFVMIIAAAIMVSSGPLFAGISLESLFGSLSSINPNLTGMVNPESLLFRNYFEVYVANFIVGIAIICQPHILSKSLYLKSEKDVNTYLTTAILASVLFFGILFSGLYARVFLNDPSIKVDSVMVTFITKLFHPAVLSVIILGVLSAGFSTLEGLFIALSTIFSIDLIGERSKKIFGQDSEKSLLYTTYAVLVIIAIITYAFTLDQFYHPSLSVAIFAQNGIYGLFIATFWPVFLGLFTQYRNSKVIFAATVTALIVHFGMNMLSIGTMSNNPAVTASAGLVSAGVVIAAFFFFGAKK